MNLSEQLLTLSSSLICSSVAADDDDDNNDNATGDCPATCPNCQRGCTKAAGHRMPHYCSVDKAWT